MFARSRAVLLLPALLLALAIAAAPHGARAATTTVEVGDIYFCSPEYQGGVCETVIDAGDTVVWDFGPSTLPHTTTECGASCDTPTTLPLWDSGVITDGSTFSHTFTEPGTYLYYCRVHPQFQRGRIVVRGSEPSPTEQPPVDLVPPATPTSGGALPPAGDGPSGGATPWWPAALLALAAAGLFGAGLGLRLKRQ